MTEARDLIWFHNAPEVYVMLTAKRGNNQPPTRSSINRWADQAVRTFLAAYRIVDDTAG